jgi:SAM-dependent methyltransferase
MKWNTIDDLRPELDPIVAELGRFPTTRELKERHRGYLIDAIQKFGRSREVAEALGYAYEGQLSWHTVEDLRPHLDPIVAELGRMPTLRELTKRGRYDLVNALGKFGGLGRTASLLGYFHSQRLTWNDVEDLRPHLDPIVQELGRMPSSTVLSRRQRSDLKNAIKKFGGYEEVAAALNYPYKVRGKWSRKEDLRGHLDPLVNDLGRMPTFRELRERGRLDLVGAISRFGGIREVARNLGYLHEGPREWRDVADLESELDPLVQSLGRMPTVNDLVEVGRPSMVAPIGKFGGFPAVAKKLGYPYRDRRSWSSVEDLRPELDPIVAELGRMPNNPELLARGRGDLVQAIGKFEGYPVVATALGYPYHGPRKWTSIDELKPLLDPIVAEIGRIPSREQLKARGCGYLDDAIKKFGGRRALASYFGYQTQRHDWGSVEELRPLLDPVVAELGRMPSNRELKQREIRLEAAIRNFGGPAEVAEALDYPRDQPKEWNEIEDLGRELAPLVTELGRMPRKRELMARHRYDLTNAIVKFGGYPEVARRLGYPYVAKRLEWTGVEDLRPHLGPLVSEIGHMPTVTELTARGRGGLMGPIRKFGGPDAVAEALGYPRERRREWGSIEDLRPELDPFVAELGRMPNKGELLAQGRFDLRGAIYKFGGAATVAEALGYPYEFAPAIERRKRIKHLESALIELHHSEMLSAGQVMVVLRHAGLLSVGRMVDIMRRLPVADGTAASVQNLEGELETFVEVDPDDQALGSHTPVDGFGEAAQLGAEVTSDGLFDDGEETRSEAESAAAAEGDTPGEPGVAGRGRDRTAEIRELRGWSHLGNLLDPAPALIQLSVTRLKTAFYRFANEVRGSLEAPVAQPSPEQLERLRAELWQAAFGEYGGLIDNDLVREACDAYTGDLAAALLLPRREAEFVPRFYQLDGARFVGERVASGEQPYGLLFDQPGMGKTLTTLWGLAAGGAERIAIVAPLTVKRQVWTAETIRQAFPELEEEHIAIDLDAALALPADRPAVAVLHYEELRRLDEIGRLAAPREDGALPFDALVFDEAHEVKERLSTGSSRGPTRTGAWLLRQGALACIGLTATPVVNELYEPVSLLHLAQGRRDTDAGRRLQSRRLRDRVDVMEYLLADSLRRLKPDVLFEIPPREIRVHNVVPDAELLERIRSFLGRGRRAVAAQLAEYRRAVLEGKLDWIAGAVGANLHATTAEGLPDPKTLVLCYNVDEISEKVHARLGADLGGDRVLHVCGSTPQPERDEALRRFRNPADASTGVAVLVGTVGTVGVGVTLFDPEASVTPHRVIFADLPFTWAEFEQGVDRLHRVGQKLPVRVDVPVVAFGEQLTRADGEPLESFDEWVWKWIRRKQLLADQVLDATFDVSEYRDSQIRRAIAQALRAVEDAGGAVIAPAPPADTPAAEHRRSVGRLRGMPRERAAEAFREPGASQRFLAANDASPSARLAQRLVRERLGRWLDRRSVVVDLGCGSNPLRDLPCERVVGIDRHGVNGGLEGDSAATGLSSGEADFVVMSLSMWGMAADRLAYLQEAKRLLRPLGKLVIVEPAQSFGATDRKPGVARLAAVLERLGMHLAEDRPYAVDAGTGLLAFVVDNSSTPPEQEIDPNDCDWSG